MTQVERSIYIEAPVEVALEVGLDPATWLEWYAGMQQAEPDDVYPEAGGVVHIKTRSAGLTLDLTGTVTDYTPGRSIRYTLEGMIEGSMAWVYDPEGDGTRLTATFDYEMPGGLLGQAANKLIVERSNTENLERSLENLKALVEGRG